MGVKSSKEKEYGAEYVFNILGGKVNCKTKKMLNSKKGAKHSSKLNLRCDNCPMLVFQGAHWRRPRSC